VTHALRAGHARTDRSASHVAASSCAMWPRSPASSVRRYL
jgi:hypothetical protein